MELKSFKLQEFVDECLSAKLIGKNGNVLNVTLKPADFPYEKYLEVYEKQKIVNKLFLHASQDKELLSTENQDRMFNILRTMCRKREEKNPIQAVFIRTDYLLDKESSLMKQVEINTIACSFLVYGPVINRIHQRLYGAVVSQSDKGFVDMVSLVQKEFKRRYQVEDCVALMIDEKTTSQVSNAHEKFSLIEMLEKSGITMLHVTMEDIRKESSFTRGAMKYKGKRVFFNYYRWFYNADHYTNEDIKTREQIEFSDAVSLPNAELQLVGIKIFQTIFKDKNILRRYLQEDEIEALYGHFGDFKKPSEYAEGDEQDFVLKSMGEGGNNLITSDFGKFLQSKEHFLMKKIVSPTFKSANVLNVSETPSICEVGIFGSALSFDGEVTLNESIGYIARTKGEQSAECGVTSGFGFLDSIAQPKASET